MDRKTILDIVVNRPGSTGLQIHQALVRRSRAGRTFGEDSWLSVLFGPSIGGMYVHLAAMEDSGELISEWGERRSSGHRPRHYFATTTCNE